MEKQTISYKRIGAITSLYMALAYLSGIIIFMAILKYPEITNPIEKLAVMTQMPDMVFFTNVLMYVLFGPVLVLFIISVNKLVSNSDSVLLKASSVIGFIWAGSLSACGMIANASLKPLAVMFAHSPDAAVPYWQILEAVTTGIGYGNAEILGGLMTLGFSVVLLKTEGFSKALAVFGMIVGIIGIITLAPMLSAFTALFGILQLLWFIFMAVTFIRKA